MSHLLDEILAQAANGSPATVALSSESVAVLLFASEFVERRSNWLDRGVDPLDEVTDADWDEIEKLVGNAYEEIMHPVLAVGALEMWLTGTPPDAWLICDGQAVSRDDYAELFGLWGTTWGPGDGSTTFNLPDMRSLHPKGAGGVIGLGVIAGSSVVTLNTGNLPAHNHGITDPGHVHSITDPGHTHPQRQNVSPSFQGGAAGANVSYGSVSSNSATRVSTDNNTTGISVQSHTTGITTQNTGLGDYFSTAQPSIGVNYIVYTGVGA